MNYLFKKLTSVSKSWKILTVLVVFVAYLYMLPSPIDPPAYRYPKPPALKGPLQKNSILHKAEQLFKGQVVGPESFAANKNGTIFTGLADGRVVGFKGNDIWEITRFGKNLPECGSFQLEPICGRPKGMKIDKNGDLLVLDSYTGLYKVNVQTGEKEFLVSSAKGFGNVPFKFLNGLDIDSEGLIYFTDSSTKWDRRNYRYEVMELRNTGRFLRYNPDTCELRLLLDNMYLPNGVAISADGSFIVISEMNICLLRRYYLKGPKAGQSDIFAENLPGYADNIKLNSHGNFYVGLGAVRYEGISRLGPFLDLVGPYPNLKKFIAKVTPLALFDVFIPKHSMILEYDNNGNLVSSLHDPTAQVIPAAGEGFEHDNVLYIGNFKIPFIGKLKLENFNND
ncbi:adipocyte plasma membrane-associated protein-like [Mytilus trossulus]|uniref:adipocyte plasma membrane-associated protein-like n=1 Tax=Mytilus trossulus TaxID=6551 RepID=UPI0030065CFD